MVRFRRRMKMSHRIVCLGLACALVSCPACVGHAQSLRDEDPGNVPLQGFQKSQFPEWMNEASQQETSGKPPRNDAEPKVADPVEPIDPDADSGTSAQRESQTRPRFRFTPPKMPDFSRFREQSTRTVTEQHAESASRQPEQASAAGLLPLPAGLLASLTMPAVDVPAGRPPKADIPKRFHRPAGYRSFMQESLTETSGEKTESATSSGE